MRKLIIIILSWSSYTLFAQDPIVFSKNADKFYRDSQFVEAEELYRKADHLKPEFKNKYNLGNSLYNQNRMQEAAKSYEESIGRTESKIEKSKSYYNLGNSYFHQKEYQKSVEAYKESLKLNSNDLETKKNLAIAKKMKQQQ
ncbi:MAG TPA: tetratricopeptide repeat protein, partial [Saprospiraceae bacterium]|nr:tetratricopeptide repeat protein [Saprospiraceae bacterium]